ncbi:MAG: hypothetical protein ABFS41_00860 [Myxococcota bacterium]
MEDRLTAVLQLETSDLEPEAWLAERAAPLLAVPAVERVSAWTNCALHRTDLPRTLPEFATLGVVEAQAPFAAPAPPRGVTTHQFRQVRPGQGVLRGPTLGLELVLISPKHQTGAQALRDWADFVHIHHIAAAAVPGFAMITPYENVSGGRPRFLHFYEMDTEEAEDAFQRMTPATLVRLPEKAERRAWMGHPELVIDYVSTFRLVAESPSRP